MNLRRNTQAERGIRTSSAVRQRGHERDLASDWCRSNYGVGPRGGGRADKRGNGDQDIFAKGVGEGSEMEPNAYSHLYFRNHSEVYYA